MSKTAGEIESPHLFARKLAHRFEAIGEDPYASDKERILVPLDNTGEIIDLGRPLKNTRIFGPTALRKNIPVVDDFADFAVKDGLKDCYFWCIKLTGSKAMCPDLSTELAGFNAKIEAEFTELRKKYRFEMLLTAIHPRYDHPTGKFDLHAHLICRVPPEHFEAVYIRLGCKFSLSDMPRSRIRKPAAVMTYILWGIWRNKHMTLWPDEALKAAWNLSQSRSRLVRFGGAFQKYRANQRQKTNDNVKNKRTTQDRDILAANRAATADPRMEIYDTGDRILTKVNITRNGERMAALLYEVSGKYQQIDVPETTEVPASSNGVPVSEDITVAVFDKTEKPSAKPAQSGVLGGAEILYSPASSTVTPEIIKSKTLSSISKFAISKFRHLKPKITQIFEVAGRIWDRCSRALVANSVKISHKNEKQ